MTSNVEIRILRHKKGRYQTHILEETKPLKKEGLTPSIPKGETQHDKRQHTT